MGRVNREKHIYTVLSEITHLAQYANIVAVIDTITPKINKHNKLDKISLVLVDQTKSYPGFNFTMKFDSNLLTKFFEVAIRGMLVELLEVKIVKNDGEVYGIISEEKELRLIKDNLTYIKWYPDEEKNSLSDDKISLLRDLIAWKTSNLPPTQNLLNFNQDSNIRMTRAKENQDEIPKKTNIPRTKSLSSNFKTLADNTVISERTSRSKLVNPTDKTHPQRQNSSIARGSNSVNSIISTVDEKSTLKPNRKLQKTKSLSNISFKKIVEVESGNKCDNIRKMGSRSSLKKTKQQLKSDLTPDDSNIRTTRAKENQVQIPKKTNISRTKSLSSNFKTLADNTVISEITSRSKLVNPIDKTHPKRQNSSSVARGSNSVNSIISTVDEKSTLKPNSKLQKAKSLSNISFKKIVEVDIGNKFDNIRKMGSKSPLKKTKQQLKSDLTLDDSNIRTTRAKENQVQIPKKTNISRTKSLSSNFKTLADNTVISEITSRSKLVNPIDKTHPKRQNSSSVARGSNSVNSIISTVDEKSTLKPNRKLQKAKSLSNISFKKIVEVDSGNKFDNIRKMGSRSSLKKTKQLKSDLTLNDSNELKNDASLKRPKGISCTNSFVSNDGTKVLNKRKLSDNDNNFANRCDSKKMKNSNSTISTDSDHSVNESIRGKLRESLGNKTLEDYKGNDESHKNKNRKIHSDSIGSFHSDESIVSPIRNKGENKKTIDSQGMDEKNNSKKKRNNYSTQKSDADDSIVESLQHKLRNKAESQNAVEDKKMVTNSACIQSHMPVKSASLPDLSSTNAVGTNQLLNLSKRSRLNACHSTLKVLESSESDTSLEGGSGINKCFAKRSKAENKNVKDNYTSSACKKEDKNLLKLALHSSDSSISSSNSSNLSSKSINLKKKKQNSSAKEVPKEKLVSNNKNREVLKSKTDQQCLSKLNHGEEISVVNKKISAGLDESSQKTLTLLNKKATDINVIPPSKTIHLVKNSKKVNEKTQSRNSLNRNNKIQNTLHNANSTDPLVTYLEPLTRNVHIKEIKLLNDISLCDLEEVNVPDKFDLVCKVVSINTLVDDGIQIIRVQDGKLSKSDNLIIPRCPSWKEIVESIEKQPVIKRNPPYIDIIIFDYTRVQLNIVPGKYYKLCNIMAIRLNVKNDPRKNVGKNELFFCVEGKSINPRTMGLQQDIERMIKAEKYQKAWREIYSEIPIEQEVAVEEVEEKSTSKKPRIEDIGDECVLKETAQKNKVEGNKRKAAENVQKCFNPKDYNNKKCRLKLLNSTTSSEEVETPPIIRELSEIMHEESLLGLPFEPSEDIHLKNSGSEITFSQFFKNADLKSKTFRTSTQDEVPTTPTDNFVDDKDGSIDMDLALSPSSAESVLMEEGSEQSKTNKSPEECSPSVIHNYKQRAIDSIQKHKRKLFPTSSTSKTKDQSGKKNKVTESYCVNVSSSDSSEIVCEEDVRKSGYCKETNRTDCKPPSDCIQLPTTPVNNPPSSVEDVSGKSTQKSPEHLKASDVEEIEVVSCSTSASIMSVGGTYPYGKHKKSSVSNLQKTITGPIDESIDPPSGSHVIFTEERLRAIPSRAFYKSSLKPPVLTNEQFNEIYNDEDGPATYCTYSFHRHLPFVDLHTYRKISDHGYITITAIVSSITPPFGDSWQECCFKSSCPSCGKLYNVYNAATNEHPENSPPDSALCVGGHIVCPDSKCCNQVLDTPEFHLSVQLKVKDSCSPITALIGEKYAEDVFGCSAKEALKDQTEMKKVGEILKRISESVEAADPIKLILTRENIYDPKTGPLFIKAFKL